MSAAPTRTTSSPGFSFGNGNLLDANIFAPVEDGGLHGAAPGEKRVLDGLAAQADGGFDRLATFDDYCLDGIQAGFDDRFYCIQASLDDVLDLLAALFDYGFYRLAAAEDRVFHRARHAISPSAPLRQVQAQS